MQTLDNLVEDTSIGRVLLMAYMAILIIASVIVLSVSLLLAHQQGSIVQSEMSQFYGIPSEGAELTVCYNGMLHYKNMGAFSGLLSYSPVIPCTKESHQKMQGTNYIEIALLAMLFILIGGFTFWQLRSEVREKIK